MGNRSAVTTMHNFVSSLLYPIIFGLGLMLLLALWEVGTAIGERFWVLKKISLKENMADFYSNSNIDFFLRFNGLSSNT